jgi:hypothetical protein
MNNQEKPAATRNQRRFWVVMNYTSLVIILSVFYCLHNTPASKLWLIAEILPLGILIYSHRKAYGKTNLWKLTHSPGSQLDERELQVVYQAVSVSYVAFVVVVLLLVYGFALVDRGPVDILLAGALLYLAHILPASFLAWNQKWI